MTTTFRKRLERLESAARSKLATAGNVPLPEMMGRVESALGLTEGILPRSPEDATAAGYESMAAATAAALGMTVQELRAELYAAR